MTGWLDLSMLIAASIAALAFGILAAFAILRVGFALLGAPRRQSPAKARPQIAQLS